MGDVDRKAVLTDLAHVEGLARSLSRRAGMLGVGDDCPHLAAAGEQLTKAVERLAVAGGYLRTAEAARVTAAGTGVG